MDPGARARPEPPGGRTWPARALLALIRGYRLVPKGPVRRCRFHPSCSSYALDAVRRHGAARGSWLTAKRIARCHPFNAGGIDHVPEAGRTASPPTPAAG